MAWTRSPESLPLLKLVDVLIKVSRLRSTKVTLETVSHFSGELLRNDRNNILQVVIINERVNLFRVWWRRVPRNSRVRG